MQITKMLKTAVLATLVILASFIFIQQNLPLGSKTIQTAESENSAESGAASIKVVLVERIIETADQEVAPNSIRINNPNDILEKRKKLINYIFKSDSLPSKQPDIVEYDFKDENLFRSKSLKGVDKIHVSMDYGLNSIVYLFHPINPNNNLVIYHQGHRGDFRTFGNDTINYLLEKGYSVLALSMPLIGLNEKKAVEIDGQTIKLEGHDDFKALESENFSPVKFFLEPLSIALNHVQNESNYKNIFFIGVSGGGWTGELYSALDDRILRTYSFAGSLPFYFPEEGRDYEQTVPALYEIAGYREIYIMASYGENRKLAKILNKYDSCCWAGISYMNKPFAEDLKSLLNSLGKGEFEVIINDREETRINDFNDQSATFKINSDITPLENGKLKMETWTEMSIPVAEFESLGTEKNIVDYVRGKLNNTNVLRLTDYIYNVHSISKRMLENVLLDIGSAA